jgi:hypothetical protein
MRSSRRLASHTQFIAIDLVGVVEIDDGFDDGWPHRDYMFVATACGAAEVVRLFAAISPDLILPAGRRGPFVRAGVIRLEEIDITAGHQLWALSWDHDLAKNDSTANDCAAFERAEYCINRSTCSHHLWALIALFMMFLEGRRDAGAGRMGWASDRFASQPRSIVGFAR